ncbi:PD40 domain-containing protein [bacterium]|nr:PD40 domain-containing protein [bacterium]
MSERFLITAQSGPLSKIFVVRRDGRDWHRLTNQAGSEADAAYSPARGEVFYRKLVRNNWELAAWNLDRREERIIHQHLALERQPAPSPDGSQLAFTSNRYGNDEIMLLRLDQPDSEPERLTWDQGQDSNPNWSPDGKSLVFASRRNGQSDLYSVDVETGKQRRLTNSNQDEVDPRWSPDGEKILFQTTRTRYSQGLVGVLQLQNLETSYYPEVGGSAHQPSWSPDGNSILYLDYRSARAPSSPALMLFSPGTREAEPIVLYRQEFELTRWSFRQASWNVAGLGL